MLDLSRARAFKKKAVKWSAWDVAKTASQGHG